MDALTLHRIHFAFTITYHYLFPQLTMGLALLIVVSPLKCRGENSSPNGVVVSGWQFRLAASTPDAAAHADATIDRLQRWSGLMPAHSRPTKS